MTDSELQEAARVIGHRVLGSPATVRRCRSFENFVAILSFEGNQDDRVIKLSRDNDWTFPAESYLYPLMQSVGLPVPEVEVALPERSEDSVPFIIMRKFSDGTLNEFCEEDSKAALKACEAAGRFISALHQRFHDLFMTGVLRGDLSEERTADGGGPDLRAVTDYDSKLAEAIEEYIAGLIRPTGQRLVHGDYTTHNVLADAAGEICVVDCAYLHLSSPTEDLYKLLASHDGWSSGSGRTDQRVAIIEGFGVVDEGEIEEMRYWDICHYVHLAKMRLDAKNDPSDYVDLIKRSFWRA